MLFQLNNETPFRLDGSGCDLSKETSDNKIETPIATLKQQVSNYKEVLTGRFMVPESKLFRSLPINPQHMLSFIARNMDDLGAIRIYLAKESTDPEKDDFKLIVVPCRAVKDAGGAISNYEDKLGTTDGQTSFILSFSCRKPPDCTFGALLL